ncbi:hypothetical protein K458DRAFT_391340 [Lentithecium fluviatile CBS 122367]|uniref:Uncharacterized protein n=1 Tax=Lentithecium fluviatile CBS 122367 TaxID=1168545 RepID=A0A6G1IUA8_9PLEO|nr:hypothetical protein K458DRAFT_391340 [Lentithecium fluviatile CBS 122367]
MALRDAYFFVHAVHFKDRKCMGRFNVEDSSARNEERDVEAAERDVVAKAMFTSEVAPPTAFTNITVANKFLTVPVYNPFMGSNVNGASGGESHESGRSDKKRGVSDGLDGGVQKKAKTQDNQSMLHSITAKNSAESPLVRFPKEMRNMIYAYTIRGYDIYPLAACAGKVAHFDELAAPGRVGFDGENAAAYGVGVDPIAEIRRETE